MQPRASIRSLLARIPGAAPVWLAFLGLALLVAGPLLGRGWLFLLDFPSGPADHRVVFAPAAGSGDLGNGVPLEIVCFLLAHALGPSAADKLFGFPSSMGSRSRVTTTASLGFRGRTGS